ncbi:MAG TPA: 2-phospho-L-lactate guanylyltransferase [Chloroflexia bacterium]|nr:2-phospho-L-lactate guanylyltransferase [Chloroflexia bacterium]
MKTVAVVPVKSLREAKSRLSGALTPQERATLTHDLLDHVLGTIYESGAVDAVGVISPDFYGLSLPLWVVPIEQTKQGLNGLLEHGRQWAMAEGADALMVIFADLPLLTPGDVRSIIELGRDRGTVVLAPDRHGQGTNVMLSHPVELAHFAYGPNSFKAHQDAAREAGAHVEIYTSPGTALDVDTPDDLTQVDFRTDLGFNIQIQERV